MAVWSCLASLGGRSDPLGPSWGWSWQCLAPHDWDWPGSAWLTPSPAWRGPARFGSAQARPQTPQDRSRPKEITQDERPKPSKMKTPPYSNCTFGVSSPVGKKLAIWGCPGPSGGCSGPSCGCLGQPGRLRVVRGWAWRRLAHLSVAWPSAARLQPGLAWNLSFFLE